MCQFVLVLHVPSRLPLLLKPPLKGITSVCQFVLVLHVPSRLPLLLTPPLKGIASSSALTVLKLIYWTNTSQ